MARMNWDRVNREKKFQSNNTVGQEDAGEYVSEKDPYEKIPDHGQTVLSTSEWKDRIDAFFDSRKKREE